MNRGNRLPPGTLTPEQGLILSALRTNHGSDDRIREQLRTGVDWQVLRGTALDQGVLPVVAARLEHIGRDLVPDDEVARLNELRRANARRSLLLTAELLRILDLLGSRGIDAIPFKGPVLAAQAYGDSGLRQFADLDVLVRRHDLLQVRDVLQGEGYLSCERMTAAQERAHLKRANEIAFVSPKGTVYLDVHWRFAADYFSVKLDTEATFARQATFSLEGRRIPVLATDDLLLYLCFHGMFHLWTKVGAVCDVARLIEANRELDWQCLLGKAERTGLRRSFLLGAALAQDVLAVEIPSVVSEAAAHDRALQQLRQKVRSRLFLRSSGEPGFLETARFQLRAKEGFRDRLFYCYVRTCFPTIEDWKLIALPDGLYPFYYFVRPLRLAGLFSGRRCPKNN